jgi:hypothetical protein
MYFQKVLHFLAGVGWTMGLIWIGLCAFSIGLLILMYTRWGQSHPLEKCMGLSLLAHALLVGYATTVSLSEPASPGEPAFQVAMIEGDSSENGAIEPAASEGETGVKDDQLWDTLPHNPLALPEAAKKERQATETPAAERATAAETKPLPGEPALDKTAMVKTASLDPKLSMIDEKFTPGTPTESVAPPLETQQSQPREASHPALVAVLAHPPPSNISSENDSPLEPVRMSNGEIPRELMHPMFSPPRIDTSIPDATGSLLKTAMRHRGEASSSDHASAEMPDAYKLRVLPNRVGIAQSHGGSPETEKAVEAALKWLADRQATDGRWKAGEHGAGRDDNVLGHSRQNAGSQADTGVTGLALLAFLAAGNTHEQGAYKENLRRGLEYLIRTQARDGSLGGDAAVYEFMYCHAMATCALSEAYGMTHEAKLRESVERAIHYSIAAQDVHGGGWRYHPGDPGDTSQLGWQLMALKSADLAGVAMPDSTRRGIANFLKSVSSGKHGGLASYRAGEQVTHAMTAEALVCRQFLGVSREQPSCNEAGDYLLTQLPGQGGKANDYYWYYGTLAMYQLQGDYWKKWNAALQKTLLERQIKDGPHAGAWDTDTVWGGYGGRIYTTAIAALSLEVYYRFLPLYAEP